MYAKITSKHGDYNMSIKNSLRLSLILLASLPLVFMTFLTYLLSYNKYIELAEDSAADLAKTYADGFNVQLNLQIAEIEGLSNVNSIQNIALENYNGIPLGTDSDFYEAVHTLLCDTSNYMDNNVHYYVYDINGYFIASSDSSSTGDWEEYMSIPVDEITSTQIISCSNINKKENSIELVTPIKFKDTTIGLIRANISAEYFGAYIPSTGDAFILTADGEYLFSATGFSSSADMEKKALELFNSSEDSGHINTNSSSLKKIYGYSLITEHDWLYIIKQDGKETQELISALPITLIITLVIILIIAYQISHVLVHKYTDPIITLKDNMTEAAAGNLDLVCNIDTKDEFGELSDKFNNMMNIISNNYKQLNESKRQLEANELELKKNYAHIEQLAYRDGLTGLYNRVAFMKYAYDIFHRDGTQFSKHAIFFIDLDNFKNVNDTLGHDYGDLLLKRVSNKLLSYTSGDDILARTGGDEFLIFKTDYTTLDDLNSFAKTLVDIAREPFDLDGEVAHISMSIGIALFPRDGLTISELIKNADIAMYSAKNSGKNSYKFFNSYMEDDFNRRNDLAEILSTVIDKNEVYLQYQPQVNVSTGKITGFESLMRIESELVGFIPPSEFIPIAEDSGVINQLGEWALVEACNFNNKLIKQGFGPLKVSVNVSTTQLQDPNLIEAIKSIPQKTGMDLKYLEVEITESVLMNSFEHNLELINEIKSLGASIALDDFGTGYSSFNYLTQIPIDTLKIDKSFIDGICSNEKDKCIADSIISLAHKMNISVVAEGVEDKDQLKILQSQFCDTLQGYLFSRPLKDEAFIDFLVDNISSTTKLQ